MSTNKIILNNALLIFMGIALYFFLMKLLNLNDVSELRYLNFLFVLWGVNRAIKTNMKINNDASYTGNFSIGLATSIIGVAFSIIGLIIYVGFIDNSFMNVLENSNFWGKNLTLSMVVFALAIEGIASSVICSFIFMQYYKDYKVGNTQLDKI